jgi:sugar lactone lactonase YvrE
MTGAALIEDDRPAPIEQVATFPDAMPAGVAVSATGRIFVSFPRCGDEVPATLTELRSGRGEPYPDQGRNSPQRLGDSNAFLSVQGVAVDAVDRLWALDNGSPLFQPSEPGGPKLVGIDLTNDTVGRTIPLPPEVAPPHSYLRDLAFDPGRGAEGTAYLSDAADSGPNAIIVVDLATGAAWRRLHDHPSTRAEPPARFRPLVEGRPLLDRPPEGPVRPVSIGAAGLAVAGDRLYYCPLASRRLYSVALDELTNRGLDDVKVAATVIDEGDKGTGSDGLAADSAGSLYLTGYEHDAILRRLPDGAYTTLAYDPRLMWPSGVCVASDGHLYVVASQWHRQPRYHWGLDRRLRPYGLYRVPIDAGPVRPT